MSTDDGLFFIDANRYLHLYRTEKGKLILKALREQTDHIFVTQQVVDEVKRNTIKVTSDFLTNQFRELKLRPSDRRRHHRAIDPDSDESAAAGGDRATCRRRPRSYAETEAKSPKLTIALPRSTAGSTKEAEALLAELT